MFDIKVNTYTVIGADDIELNKTSILESLFGSMSKPDSKVAYSLDSDNLSWFQIEPLYPKGIITIPQIMTVALQYITDLNTKCLKSIQEGKLKMGYQLLFQYWKPDGMPFPIVDISEAQETLFWKTKFNYFLPAYEVRNTEMSFERPSGPTTAQLQSVTLSVDIDNTGKLIGFDMDFFPVGGKKNYKLLPEFFINNSLPLLHYFINKENSIIDPFIVDTSVGCFSPFNNTPILDGFLEDAENPVFSSVLSFIIDPDLIIPPIV